MGTILNNATLTVKTADTFAGLTAATATSFMARAREYEASDEDEKVDVAGAGSPRKKHQHHSASGTLMLRGVVLASSAPFMFKAAGAVSPVGKWIQTSMIPTSTLSSPEVITGRISKWKHGASRGEAQVEEVEIDTDPDLPEVEEE